MPLKIMVCRKESAAYMLLPHGNTSDVHLQAQSLQLYAVADYP